MALTVMFWLLVLQNVFITSVGDPVTAPTTPYNAFTANENLTVTTELRRTLDQEVKTTILCTPEPNLIHPQKMYHNWTLVMTFWLPYFCVLVFLVTLILAFRYWCLPHLATYLNYHMGVQSTMTTEEEDSGFGEDQV